MESMESIAAGHSLSASGRRANIRALVARQGVVRTEDLSQAFEVSLVTIRNDLDLLSREGVLIRDRGGAVANTTTTMTTAFNQRAELNLEEKRRIGVAAARLVQAGDTVILDAGSTMMEMAKQMVEVSPLTVVTNALNVAMQVGSLRDVNVILIGGSLNRDTISIIGPTASQNLQDLRVQKAFISTHAMDEIGLTDPSIEVAQVKRAMIQAARQVILVVDSSKWRKQGFAKVVELAAIHTIVTDDRLPDDAVSIIERRGIELIRV
jgi:DeoR family transcriptional regulator, aga operon transcriptional repressor